MFAGVGVALVTPFKNGALDEDGLRRVVRYTLDQGVENLFPTGCTGEAATLSLEEKLKVWSICLEEAQGKAKVIAGTGTNDTASTIALSKRAADLGVHGLMLISPYYNKPSQAGLAAHYTAVADAVDQPIVVYNVPGRTGINILPQTSAVMAKHPRIVAIKEASGSVDQVTDLLRRETGLTVLSGDDTLTLPMMAAGAHGVVSVLGHLAGGALVQMLAAFKEGNITEAARIHRDLFSLTQSLFAESNPSPVKAALAHLGLIENELRLPLVPATSGVRDLVVQELGACRSAAPAPVA